MNSEWATTANQIIAEQADEIERLQGEVASVTADRDERAVQKGELLDEIERLQAAIEAWYGIKADRDMWIKKADTFERRVVELQAELAVYQPELTTDERAALDALPDDLVNKLWRQSAEAAKEGGDDE